MNEKRKLINKLRLEFVEIRTKNSVLKSIIEKINSGNADFSDTFKYADISSKLLGEFLAEKISEFPPEACEYICVELLKAQHQDINRKTAKVQTALDENQGLNLSPQKAVFPFERANQIAHSLADPTVPIETIIRRAGAPVANVAKSFHDDYIKENAKFRSDAGLKCFITRTTDGKCCEWCTKIAGRYVYGEHPDDIFRRHDNCGCTVTFENGRKRQDVWSKKTWEAPEVKNTEYKPTVLNSEQAKTLQAKNMRFKGVDKSDGSDIIKADEVIGRSVGAAGKNYPVKLPDGNHAKLAEGSTISKIKVFAGKGTDTPIRNAIYLESDYGIPADKWQKVRGEGTIIFEGKNRTAELHWYEADNEKYDMKVKRWLDES